MTLGEYARILRLRWMMVAFIACLSVALTAAATLFTQKKYTAVSDVYISVAGGGSVSDVAQGSIFTEAQMASYARVVTSPLVLTPVIKQLAMQETPESLASKLSVETPPNTVILSVRATDADPTKVAVVANAVARQLKVTIEGLSPENQGRVAVRVTPMTPAVTPAAPSEPSVTRNLIAGLLAGSLLGWAAAFVAHLMDTRLRSAEDLGEVSDEPVLCTVPVGHQELAVRDAPMSAGAESYRRLRTNLQFVMPLNAPRIVLIVSSVQGEGKTRTAINLAYASAAAGSRVLLIDGDLRRPRVAAALGLQGEIGLTTALIGQARVADIIQRTPGEPGIDVLASGHLPPNPSELLGFAAVDALLAELAGGYDLIVIDTAPVLPVTDALSLSSRVGGVILVARSGMATKRDVRSALTSLERVGAPVVGLVLNGVDVKRTDPSYYYGYGTGNEASPLESVAAALESKGSR